MADQTLNIILKATGGRVVVDALHGAELAFGALKGVISSSIGAALEAEQAQMRLSNVIDITGKSSLLSKNALLQYAEQLSQVTLFTDEQIASSLTLLAQLTDLDQNGIKRVTQAAIGLSSTFKIDLQSATEVLAKAVNGNIGALTRYIGKLDESLSPSQQLEEAMKKLGIGFDLAKKETETAGGAISLFKKQMDELLETSGSVIVESGIIQKTFDLLNKVTLKAAAGYAFLKGEMDTYTELLKAASDGNNTLSKEVEKSNAPLKKQKEILEELRLSTENVTLSQRGLGEINKQVFETMREGAARVGQEIGGLSILMGSQYREIARVGKAAAIVQATANTYLGATAAFNSLAVIPIVGPVLGAAAAAAAIASGLANVARIAEIKELGFAQGGIVPATSGGIAARIGEGGSSEAVIPLDSRRATREIRESFGGGSQMIQVSIQLDGRELANSIIDLKRQGRLQGKL